MATFDFPTTEHVPIRSIYCKVPASTHVELMRIADEEHSSLQAVVKVFLNEALEEYKRQKNGL